MLEQPGCSVHALAPDEFKHRHAERRLKDRDDAAFRHIQRCGQLRNIRWGMEALSYKTHSGTHQSKLTALLARRRCQPPPGPPLSRNSDIVTFRLTPPPCQ